MHINLNIMRFKINHTPSEDYFIIEGEDIETIRKQVFQKTEERDWEESDCWSEEI